MSQVQTFRDGDAAIFQFADSYITARPKGRRERAVKSRLYLWGHDDVTVEDPHEVSKRIAGTYTTTKGEFPEVDQAFKDYDRALLANYRRHLKAYRDVLSTDIIPEALTWSKNAGCSACPCSQGYIAKSKIVIEGLGVCDLYISEGNYRQVMAEAAAKRAAYAAEREQKTLASV